MFDGKYYGQMYEILDTEIRPKERCIKLFKLFESTYPTLLHKGWAIRTLKPILEQELEENNLTIGKLMGFV